MIFPYNKLSYTGVGATINSCTTNFNSTIPTAALKVANKTLAVLNKMDKTIVVARVDLYKFKGKYIVNEIETGPGIDNSDLKSLKEKWNLDIHIANRLVKLAKNK